MTAISIHPMELAKDAVLAVHPITGKRGTWTVTGPPTVFEGVAEIEVNDDLGVHSCIPVSVHTTLTVQPSERQELISGLRALAQFLEDNPDVPVGLCPSTDFNYFPSNEPGVADLFGEVDRIAALIGEKPRAGVHYMAVKDFGPVSYRAVVCKHKPVTVTAPATDAAVSA